MRFASAATCLLAMAGGVGAMAVHPYIFPGRAGPTPDAQTTTERLPQEEQPPPPLVVFIHGRIEDLPGGVPRPAELYGDFCRDLAERMPPSACILLPEFDGLYGELRREPRDLRLGPISSAVGATIREIAGEQQQEGRRLVVVSYSMGAAILLKLLGSDPDFARAVDRLILLEPVWRCWLPFAVAKPESVSDATALVLFGTNDDLTRDYSGRSVVGSLRPFLPNLTALGLEGGNHFGICSGVSMASDGLARGMTTSELRRDTIDRITSFCGWD